MKVELQLQFKGKFTAHGNSYATLFSLSAGLPQIVPHNATLHVIIITTLESPCVEGGLHGTATGGWHQLGKICCEAPCLEQHPLKTRYLMQEGLLDKSFEINCTAIAVRVNIAQLSTRIECR